jgi:hypothetical protein
MITLFDFDHYIGGDMSASNTGGIGVVGGTVRGQQRVLRRLLTNPGDYIFEPNYGAGLPQWIGQVADLGKLRALILGQMLLEPSVAANPSPTVDLSQLPNTQGGGFSVALAYTDAASGEAVALSFNVTN